MKKKFLAMCTAGLFLAAVGLTISTNTDGSVSFFSKANATLVDGGWVLMTGTCNSDPKITIKVCGKGDETSCTPEGTCP